MNELIKYMGDNFGLNGIGFFAMFLYINKKDKQMLENHRKAEEKSESFINKLTVINERQTDELKISIDKFDATIRELAKSITTDVKRVKGDVKHIDKQVETMSIKIDNIEKEVKTLGGNK